MDISVFITNLGKYNEGALVGEWLNLPTIKEEVGEVLARIGIDGIQMKRSFSLIMSRILMGYRRLLGNI